MLLAGINTATKVAHARTKAEKKRASPLCIDFNQITLDVMRNLYDEYKASGELHLMFPGILKGDPVPPRP